MQIRSSHPSPVKDDGDPTMMHDVSCTVPYWRTGLADSRTKRGPGSCALPHKSTLDTFWTRSLLKIANFRAIMDTTQITTQNLVSATEPRQNERKKAIFLVVPSLWSLGTVLNFKTGCTHCVLCTLSNSHGTHTRDLPLTN